MEEFIKSLKLKTEGKYSEDKQSYVIDLKNSDAYGNAYIKLENNEELNLLEDNQVITEEGSSLVFESIDKPYIVSLLADWTADIYQIVITRID